MADGISPISYRISAVLKSLYFPISYPTVFDSLKKRGYTLLPIPFLPSVPVGARAYIGGRIASKKECYVDIDPNRKIVGCEGRSIDDVIEIAKELVDMTMKDFGARKEDTDYYELIANLDVASTKGSRAKIEKALKSEFYTKISAVLKENMSPYAITVVLSQKSPSDRVWFDITIKPDLIKSNNGYNIGVVYRHDNGDNVLSFAKELNSKILEVIRLIEE
jgi:hypothetical protein